MSVHPLERVVGSGVCANAALFGFVWFDYLYTGFETNGQSIPSFVFFPLMGALVFAAAAIVWFFKPRAGVVLGLLGAASSWWHFARLVMHVDWSRFSYLWTVNDVWRRELVAIAFLTLASVYSVVQVRLLRESSRA